MQLYSIIILVDTDDKRELCLYMAMGMMLQYVDSAVSSHITQRFVTQSETAQMAIAFKQDTLQQAV